MKKKPTPTMPERLRADLWSQIEQGVYQMADVAELAGISQPYVSQLLNKRRTAPSPRVIARLEQIARRAAVTSPVSPASRLSSSGAPASTQLGEEDASMGEARRRIQRVIERLQQLTDPGEMLQIADIVEVVVSRCSHGMRRRDHAVSPAVGDG